MVLRLQTNHHVNIYYFTVMIQYTNNVGCCKLRIDIYIYIYILVLHCSVRISYHLGSILFSICVLFWIHGSLQSGLLFPDSRIREKRQIIMLESKEKRKVEKPRLPRTAKKVDSNSIVNTMAEMGVDIEDNEQVRV